MRLVVEPGTVRVMIAGLDAAVELNGVEREIRPNDRRPTIASIL